MFFKISWLCERKEQNILKHLQTVTVTGQRSHFSAFVGGKKDIFTLIHLVSGRFVWSRFRSTCWWRTQTVLPASLICSRQKAESWCEFSRRERRPASPAASRLTAISTGGSWLSVEPAGWATNVSTLACLHREPSRHLWRFWTQRSDRFYVYVSVVYEFFQLKRLFKSRTHKQEVTSASGHRRLRVGWSKLGLVH